ncbi:MAG: MraY family glycosyltransferase [Candidatus Omnitrophota bacterium]
MGIKYIAAIAFSCLISALSVALLKKLALNKRILIPQGVPLVGGIAMGLALALASGAYFILQGAANPKIIGIVLSSLVMLVFGVVDDLRELSVKAKLCAQLAAASVLILFGVRTEIIYIGSLANIIITFIWMIGLTNAFNHLDVIDGLAGAISIITCGAFFLVSLISSDAQSAFLCLALAGAACGFVIYNLPPAKVYMGNAGSHFLGFFLAAVAIVISYAPTLEHSVALLTPLFILGLPIFDTTFLIFMRLAKKKNPFLKSDDHLTLRFLKSGLSKRMALGLIFLLAILFSLSGVVLTLVSNIQGTGIVICLIVLSLLIGFRMSKVSIDG